MKSRLMQRLRWLLFGDWPEQWASRLNSFDASISGQHAKLMEQDALRRSLRAELSGCVDANADEVEALKEQIGKLEKAVEMLGGALSRMGERVDCHADRITAVETRLQTERSQRLGWEEGFSEGIKIQLQNMEKRVEAIERGKIVVVHDDGPKHCERFYGPPQPVWIGTEPQRTFPGTSPLEPPFKITCKNEGE